MREVEMMENKNLETTNRKILFVLLFGALALISSRINFSALVGTQNQFFTLFELIGPVPGAFLGPTLGVASVLAAQLANFLLAGKAATLVNLWRILPMLFGAYYFSNPARRNNLVVPLLAILAFILHPVGSQVWYFSLFWSIPILASFFPNRLLLRSLGATFATHAVGGAAWNYLVPMTPQAWNLLIPVVMYERAVFTIGIAFTYIALNTIFEAIATATKLKRILPFIDERYTISRLSLSAL